MKLKTHLPVVAFLSASMLLLTSASSFAASDEIAATTTTLVTAAPSPTSGSPASMPPALSGGVGLPGPATIGMVALNAAGLLIRRWRKQKVTS